MSVCVRVAGRYTYPDSSTTSSSVVVVVWKSACVQRGKRQLTHDNVDSQVEGDDDPLLRCQLDALVCCIGLTTEVSPSS
jgi:hypothetical protein